MIHPRRLTGWLVGVGVFVTHALPAAAQPSPPPAAVREKAAEVFARPEFQPEGSGGSNWLLRQLQAFFAWLGGLYDNDPVLYWLILIGCIVALVGMIALIALQIRAAFAGGGRGRATDAAHAERVRLSARYRDEATRRADAGDYTEAVRFLFLALVYRLDERGRVNFRQAYTNREYLGLFADRPPARDALRVMVDTLDDHWYGQRASGRPEYDACLAVYERLATA